MEKDFQLNGLHRLLHVSNLSALAANMEKLLSEFEAKNPDKKEIIEEKRQTVLQVADAGIYIVNLYEEAVRFERKYITAEVDRLKQIMRVRKLEMENHELKEKYEGLVKFDNNK